MPLGPELRERHRLALEQLRAVGQVGARGIEERRRRQDALAPGQFDCLEEPRAQLVEHRQRRRLGERFQEQPRVVEVEQSRRGGAGRLLGRHAVQLLLRGNLPVDPQVAGGIAVDQRPVAAALVHRHDLPGLQVIDIGQQLLHLLPGQVHLRQAVDLLVGPGPHGPVVLPDAADTALGRAPANERRVEPVRHRRVADASAEKRLGEAPFHRADTVRRRVLLEPAQKLPLLLDAADHVQVAGHCRQQHGVRDRVHHQGAGAADGQAALEGSHELRGDVVDLPKRGEVVEVRADALAVAEANVDRRVDADLDALLLHPLSQGFTHARRRLHEVVHEVQASRANLLRRQVDTVLGLGVRDNRRVCAAECLLQPLASRARLEQHDVAGSTAGVRLGEGRGLRHWRRHPAEAVGDDIRRAKSLRDDGPLPLLLHVHRRQAVEGNRRRLRHQLAWLHALGSKLRERGVDVLADVEDLPVWQSDGDEGLRPGQQVGRLNLVNNGLFDLAPQECPDLVGVKLAMDVRRESRGLLDDVVCSSSGLERLTEARRHPAKDSRIQRVDHRGLVQRLRQDVVDIAGLEPDVANDLRDALGKHAQLGIDEPRIEPGRRPLTAHLERRNARRLLCRGKSIALDRIDVVEQVVLGELAPLR